LTPPEDAARRFVSAPRLPLDVDGSVFAEPWQAHAFALAVELHARGAFTWSEWAEALSEQLAAAGPDDDATGYYGHWLAALEALVIERGLTARETLTDRTRDWRQAFERTPHGRPVEL
jgi:nitrile hydratase accessory protein